MEISILQTSVLPEQEIRNTTTKKEVVTLQVRMEHLEFFISTIQPKEVKANFELPVFGTK